MSDFFLHNWADAVVIESAWRTSVSTSDEAQAEERAGLADRPFRTLSFRWTTKTRDEAQRILIALGLASTSGMSVPLYRDGAVTTAASSGATINCPTADRRFVVGKTLVIMALVGGRPSLPIVRTITAIGASTITVSATLGATYAAGSAVFPLVVTQPVLVPEVRWLTNDVAEITLTVIEPIQSALPALDTPGDDPAGFDLYDDRPIFSLEPEWSGGVSVALAREADAFDLGRGQVIAPRGSSPRFRFSSSLLFGNRADAFDFLAFFDSRGGRLAPFWFAAPMALWTPVELDTGFVDVTTAALASEADDFFTHVALVMHDGTVYVRPISAIAQNSGEWRISVSDSFPALDLADVRRVTPAWLVRFETDFVREEWVTSSACQVPFAAISLTAEEAAELDGALDTLALPKKNNYHLIEIEHGDPDAPSFLYLTDWSTAISYDSHTWVATPQLALDIPANTGGLEEGELELELLASVDALLASLVSGEPCAPVYVTVTRVSAPLAEDGGATQYHVLAYRFRVSKATSRRGVASLACVSAKSQLRVPLGAPANYQCGWTLFGRGCGLTLVSDTGTLTAIDGTDNKKVTITGVSVSVPGGTPGKTFHRGYVEKDGIRVPIRDWSSGASTTFYLTRRVPAAWVGTTVTVVAGCDKSIETCRDRWDNEEHFAGTGYAVTSHHPVHEVT